MLLLRILQCKLRACLACVSRLCLISSCHMQLKTAPFAILGAFVTIIVASIIPALRGANMEQNGAGPFTKVSTCARVEQVLWQCCMLVIESSVKLC